MRLRDKAVRKSRLIVRSVLAILLLGAITCGVYGLATAVQASAARAGGDDVAAASEHSGTHLEPNVPDTIRLEPIAPDERGARFRDVPSTVFSPTEEFPFKVGEDQ